MTSSTLPGMGGTDFDHVTADARFEARERERRGSPRDVSGGEGKPVPLAAVSEPLVQVTQELKPTSTHLIGSSCGGFAAIADA